MVGNLLGNWSFVSTKRLQHGHRCSDNQKQEIISIPDSPLRYLLLWLPSHKKYWLDFLIAEFEKTTSKLIKKAALEEWYGMSLPVLKILVDSGNLTHTTTSSLLALSLSKGVPKSLKSGHILPGAGSKVQHNNISEAKKEIVYLH